MVINSKMATTPRVPITNITQLNDDSLLHLMTYLSRMDVAALASTCKRLYNVAFWAYTKKIPNNHSFTICNEYHSCDCQEVDIRLGTRAVALLQNFGDHLSEIKLHGVVPRRYYERKAAWNISLLKRMVCHTGPDLTTLHLDNVIVNAKDVVRFPHLRTLKLYNCMDATGVDVEVPRCPGRCEVRNWSDRFRLNTAALLRGLAPPKRLEQLEITLMDIDENFLIILSKYRQLRALRMHKMRFRGTASRKYWRQLRMLSQLRDLSFVSLDVVPDLMRNMGGRDTLHILEIDDCIMCPQFGQFFRKFRELRILKLGTLSVTAGRYLIVNIFDDWAENLVNVHELQLNELNSLDFVNVTDVITALPALKTLKLNQTMFSSTYGTFNAAHFLDMVELYKVRQTQLNVQITPFFAQRLLRVPLAMQDAQRHIVNIFVEENESD